MMPYKDIFESEHGSAMWQMFIPGIFKHHVLAKCWMCGSLTTFCDMDFEAPLCSEECSRKAWEMFINDCNRS